MTDALIGRHAELQQVVEAFKTARSGQATTVVIRGEPGIGKSRFLAEALAQAELLGHVVRFGRLDDLDRHVPYAAFRAALLAALDAERDPELVEGALAIHDGLVAAAAAGSAAEALPLPRLVAELEKVLRGWAAREPLVLAIDDLHAADADTLTVLALLIRKLQGDPISFIATTRAHPPDLSVELAATIDRLGRDGLALLVDLGPLDVDDVRALARAVLDAVPDDQLLEVLWQSTKGNPFYVEEGVRSLQAADGLVVEDGRCRLSSDDPPSALRAPTTIVYRLFDLGPAARSVARALTAFRWFRLENLPLLAALTDLEPGEVDEAFDALVTAHILTRDGDGYDFAHPIVRHTLYDDLGPAERRRVHGRIADHLLAARADGREVALGDWQRTWRRRRRPATPPRSRCSPKRRRRWHPTRPHRRRPGTSGRSTCSPPRTSATVSCAPRRPERYSSRHSSTGRRPPPAAPLSRCHRDVHGRAPPRSR
ncbi:MAG: ATP-binding protein [Actinomycetota bacterium]